MPVEYHIALRSPMSVKINDGSRPGGWRREAIMALDATIESSAIIEQTESSYSDELRGTVALRTNMMYRPVGAGSEPPIAMRITVYVPMSNIAGIVPQPFKER